jgi:16S rRNA (adenine1518-N6/adenine1519-N6)-dimethyltransferase
LKQKRHAEHRARKRFGQNFLTDSLLIQQIIDVIKPKPDQLILEIGPGRAALSIPLAESGTELHLLEIDRDLAGGLQSRFRDEDRVQLHLGDALKMTFEQITGGRRFRLVGNLPYNISTPVLFHVLQWSELVVDMHFMLQQEVVKRMGASPGGKAWGRLSVMCQYYCQVIPLFGVPPEAFSPAPKVQSAFVRLIPRPRPPVEIANLASFESLVSRAFSMRRKTLRNSLRGLLDAPSIELAGIDPGRRPETLSLAEFAALSALLENNR